MSVGLVVLIAWGVGTVGGLAWCAYRHGRDGDGSDAVGDAILMPVWPAILGVVVVGAVLYGIPWALGRRARRRLPRAQALAEPKGGA